ncbi:hypothetical protein A2331_05940 [Candidatus Falkowbacteria bacterium RIFOXYB2_FULL_34_18]|uniref:RNA 2-O ribose methyltransferase substrate binding domain-containing protein n=1 Tax=Candidatus Falkowbacteria bacterium RIFOXYD2_FULL_34_120 TaxID=1798007 RepID=A0A1F5TPA7_9BACT|nr:MAG: hypothetical protein A2331_05940 [Candidatus Falkowbacteria bacterium RIFOXYB2_FULL_34_18]OGF29071.1 MAG: hypothetical protein A2500_03455 [Candidatus Falkowbacteria bacterium RIFOXYC12_FULL_34_55]OGF36119.1 MAG: hypothetical protein A2466_03515 [Candidatus Falkowbacteria bacterium RIFOXYC2_FULL_34_220]OGF38571.1 MAG: hypothetical protein A2515_04775 [Candidatus Falkowbacteria bacterium RIFOXYD12_FULL_34_57]OGF40756.1 MAG: hypothetical protein A2531_06980 [Candidatus Falkowbacteria bact
MYKIINSPQNQIIKKIIKLKKSRNRKKEKHILIEGLREIIIALKADIKIETLFFSSDISTINSKLTRNIKSEKIIQIDNKIFPKISNRENPDGYLALAAYAENDLKKYKPKNNPLILILEKLEKPGNFGAIFRTADAFGVDAIFICEAQTDLYNPNIIRASLGTVFTNKIFICSSNEAILWLQKNKIKILATTPHTDNNFYNIDYTRSAAIAIGSEDKGLTDVWLNKCDKKILIPMKGKINSLNASASAAIILTEANRQRI